MGVGSGPRLSGMQKQVLSLYRGFLRAARSKAPEDRAKMESFVSAEFRRKAKLVDHKNFLYIEYLLRRGKKQLDQLKSPDTIPVIRSPSHANPISMPVVIVLRGLVVFAGMKGLLRAA
ncbi:hypothetical protein Dimus_004532 [Dionaea muscipula]